MEPLDAKKLKYPRIAFFGFARAGKDEAAKPLIEAGYERRCFGDIIKRQMEASLGGLGIDPFTENDEVKRVIRPLLELWGDVFYDNVMEEFFRLLPPVAVNTRICRIREMEKWIKEGGVIIHLSRPGVIPATKWEAELFQEFRRFNIEQAPPGSILYRENDSDVESLHQKIKQLAEI